MTHRWLIVGVLAACHGASSTPTLALRHACDAKQYWDGASCKPRGDGAAKIAAGKDALTKGADVDTAKVAFDAADRGGPLDHDSNVTLWEQRGIAAAYVEDETAATAAFDMLLALDPSHILSYRLSTKATFVFEDVRRKVKAIPSLDVRWSHGQKVGDRIPLDVEVVADPKRFLRRATLFVRTRGETGWRAADLTLARNAQPGKERDREEPLARSARIVLPPVQAAKPVSLELYLRAYDDKGNEVLAWADPKQPREIPLRYDPPPPWYRKPWVWIASGSTLVAATGILVYAFTIAPSDKVDATVGFAK